MDSLIRVFMQGGILMFPLLLIIVVLTAITIRASWHLFARGGIDRMAVQSCLDGLLFWGGFAVIIGVLGSAMGYFKAISVVSSRGLVNPRAVWIGSAEGMVTTIAGLTILALAGVSWFLLRWRHLSQR